jgi:hypothetical protein
LRALAADEAKCLLRTLFYLDAHWGTMPLAEEIAMISDLFSQSIMCIDDFRVPGDDGYSWNQKIDVSYVAAALHRRGEVFFPARPSHEETGNRVGYAVVTVDDHLFRLLQAISDLRYHGSLGATARP